MLTIKCIVVDDEPLARLLLETHINETPFLEHLESFKNAVLAAEFLNKHKVDLMFLDIHMPKLTGIDFLKTINHPPKVIFTTAYREYAIESYELQVLDYLLKPITFERFFKAVNRLDRFVAKAETIKTSSKELQPYIFIQSNKKHIKINLDEITYIESLKDYLKIHTLEKTHTIKERISHFIEQLPENQFLRIHRSYIVSLKKITAFTQQDVEIGTIEIPIGGKYKEYILSVLKQNHT